MDTATLVAVKMAVAEIEARYVGTVYASAYDQVQRRLNEMIEEAVNRPANEQLTSCTMGIGCDETGVCYAEAHGQPERCGRKSDG